MASAGLDMPALIMPVLSERKRRRREMSITTVPEGEGALVTSDGMQSLAIVMPNDVEEVTDLMLFLVAVALRHHAEPDWVEEQIAWYHAKKNAS
jgi:hypothetical protein